MKEKTGREHTKMELHEKTAAKRLFRVLCDTGRTLATAESCTGGMIAKLMTDIPGSSQVLCGGCVSYTNAVKTGVLGVDPKIIEKDTEVSEACAKAMAEGARRLFGTDLAIATTGYAGPGGGTERDPVGTVYLAVSTADGCLCERFEAPVGSTRAQVRRLAATRALYFASELLLR